MTLAAYSAVTAFTSLLVLAKAGGAGTQRLLIAAGIICQTGTVVQLVWLCITLLIQAPDSVTKPGLAACYALVTVFLLPLAVSLGTRRNDQDHSEQQNSVVTKNDKPRPANSGHLASYVTVALFGLSVMSIRLDGML